MDEPVKVGVVSLDHHLTVTPAVAERDDLGASEVAFEGFLPVRVHLLDAVAEVVADRDGVLPLQA